jgi:predicted O-methyltransferase YrrM
MITDRLRSELAIMLSLQRKPIIEGWTTQEKAEVLAGLIIDHKPQLLVEVGVFGGRSMFAMAMALRENGMGHIWGIDPWTLEAALEGDVGEENRKWWSENMNLEEIYLGFLRAVLDLQLTKECRWVRARGIAASRMFADKSVDLVHLDANHSEVSSCNEAEAWARKVKPGGFLVADDVDWSTVAKSLKMIKSAGFTALTETKQYIVFQRNGAA